MILGFTRAGAASCWVCCAHMAVVLRCGVFCTLRFHFGMERAAPPIVQSEEHRRREPTAKHHQKHEKWRPLSTVKSKRHFMRDGTDVVSVNIGHRKDTFAGCSTKHD